MKILLLLPLLFSTVFAMEDYGTFQIQDHGQLQHPLMVNLLPETYIEESEKQETEPLLALQKSTDSVLEIIPEDPVNNLRVSREGQTEQVQVAFYKYTVDLEEAIKYIEGSARMWKTLALTGIPLFFGIGGVMGWAIFASGG